MFPNYGITNDYYYDVLPDRLSNRLIDVVFILG